MLGVLEDLKSLIGVNVYIYGKNMIIIKYQFEDHLAQ